jgi:hypothetical protein
MILSERRYPRNIDKYLLSIFLKYEIEDSSSKGHKSAFIRYGPNR